MMLLSGMKYLNATWVDLTLMHVKLNYVHSDRTTVKRRRVGLWRINLLCRTCVAATRGRQWRVESSFGSRRRSLIRITTASFTSNCSARSVRNANRTLSNTPCGTLRKLLRYVQQSVLQSFFQMHDLFFSILISNFASISLFRKVMQHCLSMLMYFFRFFFRNCF